jgi:hypothetical protein
MKSGWTRWWSHSMAFVAVVVTCLFVTSDIGQAGIQGSGYRAQSYGRATQFGSVFVNGVEYETTSARILVDGVEGSESQLRVGQVVKVEGTVNADGITGTATEVSFASSVRGSLAQVDLAGGTLVILGQRIRVLGDTLLNLPLGGLLSLVPGIQLQVSGFPNAAGEIQATRIDLLLGSSGPSRVSGLVQSLNTTTQTFLVNSQVINYSQAAIAGALANGSTVLIDGSIPAGQTVLQATNIEVSSGIGGSAGERGYVEGLVTAFTSASDFAMGAQRIATDANTRLILNGNALGPNLAVRVFGVFDEAGVLNAQEVVATATGGSTGFLGIVQEVSSDSLQVLGVDLTKSQTTAVADESTHAQRPFGLADMRVGDYVEVRGGSPTVLGTIPAAVIRRVDPQTTSYVEGKASGLLAPNLRVNGVPIITTAQTRFPTTGLLAQLRFFLEAPNRTVRVRGTPSGSALVAERIDYVQ